MGTLDAGGDVDDGWVGLSVADVGLVGWTKGDGSDVALVLHGGPGMTDYTAPMADEVLDAGDGALRVARFQQRGVPPSSESGPLTVETAVDDVFCVLDQLGVHRAVLAGHSWGAHLAYHAACAAPDRVAGLLIVDALGAVDDGGASSLRPALTQRLNAQEHARLDALALADLGPIERATAELAVWWPAYFADRSTASAMGAIEMVPHVNEALLTDAMERLARGVLEQRLPSLEVPSVHVIGDASPIDPDVNIRSAKLMAEAVIDVLPGVGHFPWLEQPGSIESATRRLLALIRNDPVDGPTSAPG